MRSRESGWRRLLTTGSVAALILMSTGVPAAVGGDGLPLLAVVGVHAGSPERDWPVPADWVTAYGEPPSPTA